MELVFISITNFIWEENIMKRHTIKYTLLTLVTSTMLICGCGSSQKPAPKQTTVDKPNVSTETSVSDIASAETSTEVETETAAPEPVFAEQVLVDQDGIKITATALGIDAFGDTELKLLIENNSEQAVMVQTRNTVVNGYTIEPIFSADIEAGKKINTSLSFMSGDLKICNIEQIATIETNFNVVDYTTWETIFTSDRITLSMDCGDYVQTYDDSGTVLYDQNGVRIISRGLYEDDIWGTYLDLYIENNSGENLMIQTRNTSVNGFMIEPSFSVDILDGTKAIRYMVFNSWDLEANQITAIETIETYFNLCNLETWENNRLSDAISITVEQ